MPSFSAMVTFALQDAGVAAIMAQERYERAVTAFDQQQLPEASEESMDWLKKLELSPTTGRPAKTAHNVLIVLTHDPAVKDKIYRDTFTDRIMGKGCCRGRLETRAIRHLSGPMLTNTDCFYISSVYLVTERRGPFAARWSTVQSRTPLTRSRNI